MDKKVSNFDKKNMENLQQNSIEFSEKDFEDLANEQKQKTKYKDCRVLTASEIDEIFKTTEFKTCAQFESFILDFVKKEVENNFDKVCEVYFKYNRFAKQKFLKTFKEGVQKIIVLNERETAKILFERYLNKSYNVLGSLSNVRNEIIEMRGDCRAYLRKLNKDKTSEFFQKSNQIKDIDTKIQKIKDTMYLFDDDTQRVMLAQIANLEQKKKEIK